MSEVTLGGARLGSGNNQKIAMRNYERSTHDLGYTWKSTMATGVLYPFMSKVALPGDTFDIDLYADVMTLPTNGPLFGSFKFQIDLFSVPIRLYHAKLHMNALGIGMKMSDIKLPLLKLPATTTDYLNFNYERWQVSPSSLLSHLGIAGVGRLSASSNRFFNAIPYLGYYDIYKQYYSNKQEEIGVFINYDNNAAPINPSGGTWDDGVNQVTIPLDATPATVSTSQFVSVEVVFSGATNVIPERIFMDVKRSGSFELVYLKDMFQTYFKASDNLVVFQKLKPDFLNTTEVQFLDYDNNNDPNAERKPELSTFPLANIDTMRENILKHFDAAPYTIDQADAIEPYRSNIRSTAGIPRSAYGLQGLACKTYQSDLFNNWISTEWIDGDNGISAITAVDTSGGSFTIDELNLSKKVYDMLNRIAVSGGTYDDWLDAVYTHDRQRSAENPIYLGGLSSEIVFQEITSNAESTNQATGGREPLGSLAGRGRMSEKRKGGKVIAKIDEPSYIMGIVSITPRICYSQGNSWDVNLQSLDDLHKPALDAIGFQDLVTDAMCAFDSVVDADANVTYKSAGKQPAWINYMTSVDVAKGSFANPKDQMFMTLNRRYEVDDNGIVDLTTYVDPSKYNYIFADARLDAENFWVQIRSNITARRKMSAKLMPNL